MKSILEVLQIAVGKSLVASFGEEYANTDPLVNATNNPKFGDYQANVALSLSKKLKQAPRAIAETIIANLEVADIAQEPQIAGPGFINFTLKPEYLAALLGEIQGSDRLGIEPVEQAEKIVVDFSSPNIAKEMHVGHLRSTIIGDSIARVLEFQGYDVLRLNHVGDWGTQFGMLITYLKEAYPEALTTADALDIGDLVSLYKKAKVRFDEDADFKETARNEVVRLQDGAADNRHAWKLLCDQSRREFQVIYDILDINLTERGESFYNPFLENVVKELEQKGLLEENDGAKCVFLEGFTNKDGDPLPVIVQKSDGGFNYATTDLAAINYRVSEDHASRIVYVTDAGQANHFAGVFQVARRAGLLPETVQAIHVPFGIVKNEKGEKIKTRAGKTIKLIDLLNEAVVRAKQDITNRLKIEEREESEEFIDNVAQIVGISAVKYADLSLKRITEYKFSYDNMLELKGNTAPYMLYAYVRVQGISRKGDIDYSELSGAKILLEEESELTLTKHLLQLTDVLKEVEKDLLPNRLCQYLFELSQKFNQFYDRCDILKAAEPQRTSRLILADLTARTLKLGLSLLGIPVLDRM